MHALVDGDIVVYRCAAATEQSDVAIACWQAGEMMQRIVDETVSDSYTCFLTGSDNFRYNIYPEYKANRADVPKPIHWAAIREYLVTNWGATVSDGCEADDMMGVTQYQSDPDTTVICSIDKDMLMIPGAHYNFVKKELTYVTELAGLRHFYYQAIMGDKVDNIPGFDGVMRTKVPKFLQWMVDTVRCMEDEKDMYLFLKEHHTAHVTLDTCLKCLWIWRKENDIWQNPMDRRTTQSLHYIRT